MGNLTSKGSQNSSRRSSTSRGSNKKRQTNNLSNINSNIDYDYDQDDFDYDYNQNQQNSLSYNYGYQNNYSEENFVEDLVSEAKVKVDSESNKYQNLN